MQRQTRTQLYEYALGTAGIVLNGEVSCIQGVLYREVPLYATSISVSFTAATV